GDRETHRHQPRRPGGRDQPGGRGIDVHPAVAGAPTRGRAEVARIGWDREPAGQRLPSRRRRPRGTRHGSGPGGSGGGGPSGTPAEPGGWSTVSRQAGGTAPRKERNRWLGY